MCIFSPGKAVSSAAPPQLVPLLEVAETRFGVLGDILVWLKPQPPALSKPVCGTAELRLGSRYVCGVGIDFLSGQVPEPGFVACSKEKGWGSGCHASAGRKEHQHDVEDTEGDGAHVDVRLTAGTMPAAIVSVVYRTPSAAICTIAELLWEIRNRGWISAGQPVSLRLYHSLQEMDIFFFFFTRNSISELLGTSFYRSLPICNYLYVLLDVLYKLLAILTNRDSGSLWTSQCCSISTNPPKFWPMAQ